MTFYRDAGGVRSLTAFLLLACPGCCCLLSSGARPPEVRVHKRYPPAHANHVIRVYLPVEEDEALRRTHPLKDYERAALRPQLGVAPAHEVLATIDVETTLFGSLELATEYAKRASRELGGDGLLLVSTRVPNTEFVLFETRTRFLAIRYVTE